MTDIVERLRALHTPPTGLSWDIPDLCDEAADEIERLRHLVNALGRALAIAEGTEVEEPKP